VSTNTKSLHLLGYNSAESNLGINDNGYVSGALELQLNAADSLVSPAISLFYAPDVNYKSSGTTDIMRIMANGVYTFQKRDLLTPFIKAGFGMETLQQIKRIMKTDLLSIWEFV